jgi:hypothetical protein
MKNVLFLLLLVAALFLATPAVAATIRNDDSCDVGLFPAATLLLPWFEVEIGGDRNTGESTVFTVTNTGAAPQAARVTLWTDFAYPVFSFNLYLTGYDVQKINLYDVIKRGQIAPDAEMGSESSPTGELSDDDNPRLNEESCASIPAQLPGVLITRMQSAFTIGKVPALGDEPACNTAGTPHTNAVGYATIDVVGACTSSLPTDPNYFTHEIRFDNVLIGDYIQINTDQNFAQGNPMVHIRAIPEGGTASTRNKTNLSRTFYGRLHRGSSKTIDGRQPLPSVFGVRWIEGGHGGFETYYKIWRETTVSPDAACSTYPRAFAYDAVRFDEDENPEVFDPNPIRDPPIPFEVILPAAALVSSSDESQFPPNTNGAVAGWMYVNLNDTDRPGTIAAQNWVTASMRAEGRFSVDLDAIAFGNGCTPVTPATATIGPAGNTN